MIRKYIKKVVIELLRHDRQFQAEVMDAVEQEQVDRAQPIRERKPPPPRPPRQLDLSGSCYRDERWY